MSGKTLMQDNFVADTLFPCCPMHELFESNPAYFHTVLDRYQAAGVNFVSITVGLDHYPDISFQVRELARYRAALAAAPEKYVLLNRATDFAQAQSTGKLLVGLNFQGSNMLQGDEKLVDVYRQLGVTQMLLAYNDLNLTGSGCHEPGNAPLSSYGHRLVAAMNTAGMLLDLTHTGEQSTLDAAAASTQPVIYSHSGCKAVYPHDRNISDAQITSCAATGGVVCVHGVGIFMSDTGDDISADTICRHIDHVVQLTGPEHAGIGLDYVENLDALHRIMTASVGRYAGGTNYQREKYHFAGPEVIAGIADNLLQRNYPEAAVKGILGANVKRVYEQVIG